MSQTLLLRSPDYRSPSRWSILAEPGLQSQYPGSAWHVYNALTFLTRAGHPWIEGLRQYGAGNVEYAGYAEQPLPHDALDPDVIVLSLRVTPPDAAYNQRYCAYHGTGRAGTLATVPYPAAAPCLQPGGSVACFVHYATHEFAEALSDSPPGTGWMADSGDENADECAYPGEWVMTLSGWRYLVSSYWRNDTGACWRMPS